MIRLAAASAVVAVAVLSAGAASAANYRIAVGDLNLASAEGAARFDQRVGRAARSACATGSPLVDNLCRSQFRDRAMDQLPDDLRQDYARARNSDVVVRTPAARS